MHQAYFAFIEDEQEGRWANVVAGGVPRMVDFQQMQQTNAATGKRRAIRVVTGVPSEWESAPAASLTQRDDLEIRLCQGPRCITS